MQNKLLFVLAFDGGGGDGKSLVVLLDFFWLGQTNVAKKYQLTVPALLLKKS